MGSQLQADNGVEDDSVESMVADFQANGAGKNNEEILTLFAENVGAATDWLVASCGIEFEPGLHQLGEYSHNRELAYTGRRRGLCRENAQGCGKQRRNRVPEHQGGIPAGGGRRCGGRESGFHRRHQGIHRPRCQCGAGHRRLRQQQGYAHR